MAHGISSFSYYPMTPRELGPVEATDVVPHRGEAETDVWLTEWQVAEEGFDVAVGDAIAWALVPMDLAWATRVFGDRRLIPLQLDTYGAATRDESHPDWTHLAGRVVRIDQVTMLASSTAIDRPHPDLGAGIEHQVSSLRVRRMHEGEIVGWAIRVRG